MAYRRRQREGIDDERIPSSSSSTSSTSLAAKAIRASSSSAAHRDSSLSSAYGPHHPASPLSTTPSSPSPPLQDSKSHDYTSMNTLNESKHGFWGALARKAKAILDDDVPPEGHTPTTTKYRNPYHTHQETDTPKFKKGFDAITSSLNYIGNAVEEGLTIVENRTAGIIQETRKHIRKNPQAQNQATKQPQMQAQVQPQMQTDQDIQLKASRDVAMAMAAKAKLLLRELKTVKADLAFAKERCAQLEEENKILRENRQRGDSPEDDDLIRLQLETLLAEKARLAHENSVYARENRFLREVVEYHQLTMQDVVYLDEGTEEVSEVYPIKVVSDLHSASTASVPKPSSLPPKTVSDTSLRVTREVSPHPLPSVKLAEVPKVLHH